MRVDLKFPKNKIKKVAVADAQDGAIFKYVGVSKRHLCGDNAGGVLFIKIVPLQRPKSNRIPVVSLDGKTYNQGQCDRLVKPTWQRLQLRLKKRNARKTVLKNLSAGDIFSTDKTKKEESLYLVFKSGAETSYVNIKSGKEKYFDSDQKFLSWQGDAVFWQYRA